MLKQQGKAAALKEYEEMQKSGHTDVFQYSWAMKYLCETSDESRALMESMKQNGVLPDVATFNTLINSFVQEGDINAAQHVYTVYIYFF